LTIQRSNGCDTTHVTPVPMAHARPGGIVAMAQPANPGRNSPEEAAIRQVVARLTQQFPELPADDIDRAVNGHYDRFRSSPIRDFVPVLVERATRRQLTQDER
jgi:hypothetical protein